MVAKLVRSFLDSNFVDGHAKLCKLSCRITRMLQRLLNRLQPKQSKFEFQHVACMASGLSLLTWL